MSACNRPDAIEISFADAIGEKIDQARHIRLDLFEQARGDLLRRKRLNDDGRERHQLDAETGIDGFDLVAQQPAVTALAVAERQAACRARRACAAVDTVEHDQAAARRAPCTPSSRRAVGKLADVARDRFRRADRLGEGAAHLDQLADGWPRSVRRSGWSPGQVYGRAQGRSAA